MYDVWTVAWKELKLLSHGGTRGRLWVFAFPVVFGIIMPLQSGRVWLDTPAGVGFLAVIPLILAGPWAADAFAGERERHTLETLLASRLSDRAILIGKILSVVAYAWGTALLAFLIGAVTANMAYWEGSLRFYTLPVTLAGAGFSLLVAVLAAGAGVLVSLRAATARQAQQRITAGVLAIVWIPILGLNLTNRFLPRGWLTSRLSGVDPLTAVLVMLAALMVVNLLVLVAALARFQRAKLILD